MLAGEYERQSPGSSTGVVATACMTGRSTGTREAHAMRAWPQPTIREEKVGSRWVADGFVVATKPGNSGGAKGPWFRTNARRGRRAEGLAMSLPTLLKVQKLQAALHAKAKGSPSDRCYALYDKVYRADVLEEAYERCRENDGAPGIDGQTCEDIENDGVQTWLGELAQELRDKRYRPHAVRRVYIPKPDGKQRPLGIPTIRDRVAQMAAVLVLEPIFEADLQPEQYAYRAHHLDSTLSTHRVMLLAEDGAELSWNQAVEEEDRAVVWRNQRADRAEMGVHRHRGTSGEDQPQARGVVELLSNRAGEQSGYFPVLRSLPPVARVAGGGDAPGASRR